MSNCLRKLEKLLESQKTIDDIILFGSIVKGSSEPNDLDVALILKNETELTDIKEKIREVDEKADIQIINSIYSSVWPVLMREGFSVKQEKFLFEIYKLEPMVLYKYSLTKLNPVQKVQFSRGLKSVLKDTAGKILSRSIVLVPMQDKIKFDEFLSTWNLTYEAQSYELFPIMRKEELA